MCSLEVLVVVVGCAGAVEVDKEIVDGWHDGCGWLGCGCGCGCGWCWLWLWFWLWCGTSNEGGC